MGLAGPLQDDWSSSFSFVARSRALASSASATALAMASSLLPKAFDSAACSFLISSVAASECLLLIVHRGVVLPLNRVRRLGVVLFHPFQLQKFLPSRPPRPPSRPGAPLADAASSPAAPVRVPSPRPGPPWLAGSGESCVVFEQLRELGLGVAQRVGRRPPTSASFFKLGGVLLAQRREVFSQAAAAAEASRACALAHHLAAPPPASGRRALGLGFRIERHERAGRLGPRGLEFLRRVLARGLERLRLGPPERPRPRPRAPARAPRALGRGLALRRLDLELARTGAWAIFASRWLSWSVRRSLSDVNASRSDACRAISAFRDATDASCRFWATACWSLTR